MACASRLARFASVLIVALSVDIGAAQAEVVVAAGRSVSLMTLSSIDPTCHALGPVTVNVVEQPRGGYIEVSQTKAYPSFNTLNSRSRCNTLKLPATRVSYQSAGNFLGLDFVTVEAIYPEGAVKRIRVAVSVRPIAPAPPELQGRAEMPSGRAEVPPASADAGPTGYAMPEGPLSGADPKPVMPRPKPRVRHADAQPHASERHGCKAPCVVTGKAPAPAHPVTKPAEDKTLLTPI